MIAYLTKLDASEGFEHILDFLNASMIKYALTVNPTIYVSYIKQFWSSVSLKKTNDVVRLQALIDRRKVIITEDTVRQVLYLDDVNSIDCLPNEEIFVELARMGVGKGFSRVDTPLFKGMLVPQLVNDYVADDVNDDVASNAAAEDEDVAPTPPPSPHHSPIASPSLPSQQQQPLQTTNISMELLNILLETWGKIAELDADEDVTLKEVAKDTEVQGRLEKSQAQVYHIDLEHANKVLITAAATTITAAPSAARRRKGVVIKDPEETTTPSVIVHSEPKSKDKGKGIMVEEPKPLKKQAHIEQDEACARELEAELNANINWNEVIKQLLYYGTTDTLRVSYNKLDEEVEELKTHLQIVSNDEDDVYTEATSLALKVPVIDYQIHTENNKPYYKIIRADGTHQLFLSFISLLRNFDREDLEMLWHIVQERFASLKPKNFSDDFLLKTLKTMFEKPNVEAQTYNCWYKLKVLDNAAGRKLRLLEESVVVDKKMKELH
uniref:Xylulose kinase-1 n=1 Tax=Tanacetum cinerariifolium TaxID=118510 RepID=A0A699IQH9_TANCI|nr:hypothetical protein [Tanacetum cinerariifolium]